MQELRSFVVIAVVAGVIVGVIANAGNAAKVIEAVSNAYFGLINTVAQGARPAK